MFPSLWSRLLPSSIFAWLSSRRSYTVFCSPFLVCYLLTSVVRYLWIIYGPFLLYPWHPCKRDSDPNVGFSTTELCFGLLSSARAHSCFLDSLRVHPWCSLGREGSRSFEFSSILNNLLPWVCLWTFDGIFGIAFSRVCVGHFSFQFPCLFWL